MCVLSQTMHQREVCAVCVCQRRLSQLNIQSWSANYLDCGVSGTSAHEQHPTKSPKLDSNLSHLCLKLAKPPTLISHQQFVHSKVSSPFDSLSSPPPLCNFQMPLKFVQIPEILTKINPPEHMLCLLQMCRTYTKADKVPCLSVRARPPSEPL